MRPLDCLSFGSAGFDLLVEVAGLPASDTRIPASGYAAGGGGPAATASTALARLGARAGLVTAVGDDRIGDLILAELADDGIDLSGAQRLPGVPSTVASVMIEPSGARAMAVYGGCINAIRLHEIELDRIDSARAVLTDGNNPALVRHVAPAARARGVPVLLDGGNIDGRVLPELLRDVDIYIPDIASARRQLPGVTDPLELAQAFAAMGPETVCITLGEAGSLALRGDEIVSVGPLRDIAVRDTTGAGDNFHGAFQFGLLESWPLHRILAFSNAFAALTTRSVGGRSAIPTRDEAERHARSLSATERTT
ncbi:carbohydrate kinase family protein [Salipiger marinus]|uniref:Sugar or nucleoside kinase, ribokinase family n=1 Tax=Salipiger marinus TaxID=555512 RepID=A0A1G8TDT5_9RHOB|nr:PfkB family carbohydrate kinase [Salipiger marinus]SDJ39736.1 Sugar or nucleoside kinase, ribokinase family [Salipiger marinus]